MLSLLHASIYSGFPRAGQGEEEESLRLSCPSQPQPQDVSGLGLQLLALTDRGQARHRVHTVKVRDIHSPLLLALASMASLQEERVEELEVTGAIHCLTGEEGKALGSLLELCNTWVVRRRGSHQKCQRHGSAKWIPSLMMKFKTKIIGCLLPQGDVFAVFNVVAEAMQCKSRCSWK